MPRLVATVAATVVELSVLFSAASASAVVPPRVNEMEALVVVANGAATLTLVPMADESDAVSALVSCALSVVFRLSASSEPSVVTISKVTVEPELCVN